MDIDFWARRWKDGKLGFHEGQPNAFLGKNVGLLGEGRRVLVPLCGKTEDLAFLASRGHEVVGVDAVEQAPKAFFEEHELVAQVAEGPLGRSYSGGGITIFAADFFACTPEVLGTVGAVYDRAAMGALPPDLRKRYVAHLRTLVPRSSPGLLVTLDYDQALTDGPPFSVGEAEVRRLYDGVTVALIEEATATRGSRYEKGIATKELCFSLVF